MTVYARREGQTRPVGVTVQNSLFNGGGNSDGIQVGGYGVRILHNEFTGIHQIDDTHTDAIQLYGQSHTVVRGNYIHNAASGIMAPDGTNHEIIENNVIRTDGSPRHHDGLGRGSIVRRNTLPDGSCDTTSAAGRYPSTRAIPARRAATRSSRTTSSAGSRSAMARAWRSSAATSSVAPRTAGTPGSARRSASALLARSRRADCACWRRQLLIEGREPPLRPARAARPSALLWCRRTTVGQHPSPHGGRWWGQEPHKRPLSGVAHPPRRGRRPRRAARSRGRASAAG